MADVVLDCGIMGDETQVWLRLLDHRGVTHELPMRLKVCDVDKPRVVELWVEQPGCSPRKVLSWQPSPR